MANSTGCGKRIMLESGESELLNCCLLTRTIFRMTQLDREPLEEAVHLIDDCGLVELGHDRLGGAESYHDKIVMRHYVGWRGSWRSRHRTEMEFGLYVVPWINRVLCAEASLLERRRALMLCLKDRDSRDAFKTMLTASAQAARGDRINAFEITARRSLDAENVRAILRWAG